MKRILFLTPYFFPGFRAGGPQQTVANIADMYGDCADIYILTQNYDLGIKVQYEGVKTGKWLPYRKAKVKYLPKHMYNYFGIKREYQKFAVVYSCGMFDANTISVLAVHRLARKKKKLYLAPMGVFSRRAIHSKYFKKIAFLKCMCILAMFQDIIWSFSSVKELEDARRVLGKNVIKKYMIAEDVPRPADFDYYRSEAQNYLKESGNIRIVFISRICRQKNLEFDIDILKGIKSGKVQFDIFGIVEDQGYWGECKKKIQELSENVEVRYLGTVKPHQVISVFSKYDIFLFPTKGENYGHVVYEALCAGCVPVVSNTTPWDILKERGAGEIISYGDIERFREIVKYYIKMGKKEMAVKRKKAIDLAEEKYDQSRKRNEYAPLFGQLYESNEEQPLE